MSCLGPGYEPQPPRAWSRVQNSCSLQTVNNLTAENNTIYNPFTNQYETLDQYNTVQMLQMLNKGNVLQYKKNSSNLTKQQRYSQIAKGMWTNRTKTWASQSQTSTNPNTNSLLRVDYIETNIPNSLDPFHCTNTNIKEGGKLIGNTVVNPCTGDVILKTKTENCYPTTDSNVPGAIQKLCWNDRIQTWYPKQRLQMTNSGNKWPQGYKGFVSANAIPSRTTI